jgi:hypothetical protein
MELLLQLLTILKIHLFKTFSNRHYGPLEKVVVASLEEMLLERFQSRHSQLIKEVHLKTLNHRE